MTTPLFNFHFALCILHFAFLLGLLLFLAVIWLVLSRFRFYRRWRLSCQLRRTKRNLIWLQRHIKAGGFDRSTRRQLIRDMAKDLKATTDWYLGDVQ